VELYPLEIRFIESEGARVLSRKRSSENGPCTSSSEELGYNSKRSGFRRTLVRPRRKRKERQLVWLDGEKVFSPGYRVSSKEEELWCELFKIPSCQTAFAMDSDDAHFGGETNAQT
jgi:hypothetical protein